MDGSGRFISCLSRCAVRVWAVGGRSVGSFVGRRQFCSVDTQFIVAPRERADCRFCRVARGGLALVSSKREKE